MTFIAKALLGLVSVVGSCCAIAVPVSMTSDRGTSRFRRETVSEPYQAASDQGGAEAAPQTHRVGNESLDVSVKQLSVEDLGQEIDKEYKSKRNYKNVENADLTGKEEFGKILNPGDGSEKKGDLIKQDGKNCREGSIPREEVFCGLIHLQSKEVQYRIKATYDKGKKQWKVIVVKKEGGSLSYYSSSASGSNSGISKHEEVVGFDSLDLEMQNNYRGSDMSHPSILK